MNQLTPIQFNAPEETASLLEQTEFAQRVPAPIRAEIDAILRRKPGERPAIDEIWRKQNLQSRFRVTRRIMRSYARIILAECRRTTNQEILRSLLALLAMPTEFSRELQCSSHLLLLSKIAQTLNTNEEIPPEQLLKMADALAKQETALSRARAQDLAERKFKRVLREALRSRKAGPESQAELEERVRRIYGIHLGSKTQNEKKLPKVPPKEK